MPHLLRSAVEVLGDVSPSTWISLGALVVAAYAAWYARRGTRIAEQVYNLHYAAHQRLQPALELYLVDAYIRPVPDPPRRIYVFQIRVTNKSDAANALKDVTLKIACGRRGEPPSNVIVRHNREAARAIANPPDLLRVPQSVSAHSVTGGLALFPVADPLLRGLQIDSYTISLVDAHDHEVTKDALILREVRNETAQVEQNSTPAQT